MPEQTATTLEKGHGRLSLRQIRVSQQLNDYLAPTWPAVAQVFHLTRQITRHGRARCESVVGLTSLSPRHASPERLLHLVRTHWHLENRVHWRRDVTLGEDRCTVTTAHVPQVLAVLHNTILSLMDRLGDSNMAAQMRSFAARPANGLRLLHLPL